MAGLTYATFVTAVSTLMPAEPTDTNFLAILPDCIDYTELRISRELDLLQSVVRDNSSALSANNRNFTLPTSIGTFVVVNGINAITPAGTTNPESGTRNPLLPVSRDYLEMAWPSVTGATLPNKFAMITQGAIIVGPWPDAAYTLEVVGTQRFTPLSSSNTTNFLSINLPDLYVAGAMVFLSAFMKNFGQQADDPRMAVSWEAQYNALKSSAETEEFRKRFMGSAWSSLTQGPAAVPVRS